MSFIKHTILDKTNKIYNSKVIEKNEIKQFIKHIRSIIIILCFVTTSYSYAIPDDCTDFGPTLSNVTICSANVCNFTEIIQDTIDFTKGSSACYKIISPDPDVAPTYLRIAINNAYIVYDSDYHYVTGDTVVYTEGFCGCPLGTSVSCLSCPVDINNYAYSTCFDGLHQDDDCVLNTIPGAHGTYCIKRFYSSSKDIHVYHLSKVKKIQATVEVDFNGTVWFGDYSGFQVNIDQDEFQEVSIRATSVFPVYDPDFVVWHVDYSIYPNSIPAYLLSSDYVNGLLDCSTEKIGWYKPDHNPPICSSFKDIGSSNVTIKSCDDNVFTLPNPFSDSASILSGLSQFKKNTINDQIMISSNEYVERYINNGTNSLSGQIISVFNKNVGIQFGFPDVGSVMPNPQLGSYLGEAYEINTGEIVTSGSIGISYISLFKLQDFKTNIEYYINLIWVPETQQRMICAQLASSCNSLNFQNPCFDSCLDTNITLLGFPTTNLYILSTRTFNYINNQTYFNRTTDFQLYLPISIGSLEFSFIFSGLTVNFETSTTKPYINNIVYNDLTNLLTITAKSLTTPGRCYLTSPDLFFIPKPLDLSLNLMNYDFEIESSKAIGLFNFTIRCASYFAVKSIELNINNQINDSISSSDSLPNSTIFNPFYWPSSSAWWHKLIKISIIALLIIFSIFLVFTLVIPFILFLTKIPIKYFSRINIFKRNKTTNIKQTAGRKVTIDDIIKKY